MEEKSSRRGELAGLCFFLDNGWLWPGAGAFNWRWLRVVPRKISGYGREAVERSRVVWSADRLDRVGVVDVEALDVEASIKIVMVISSYGHN